MNPFSRKAKLANEMAHQQSYSAEPYREGMDYTDEAWAYGLRALPGSLANQLQALGEYTTGKDYPNKLGNYLNELTQVNEMGYTPQTEYEAGVAFLPELVYDPAIIAGAPYTAYKAARNAPRLLNVIADEAGRTTMRNQLGMLAGPNAKNADLAMLAKAQEMKAQGVLTDDIYSETKWWLDHPDGVPRFEIDDSGATGKDIANWSWGNREDWKSGNGASGLISEFFTHPELSKNYQGIDVFSDDWKDNIAMRLTHGGGDSGSYSDASNTITVGGVTRLNGGVTPNKSTTLHELQHAIQSREGMARGGSPEMFNQAKEAELVRDAINWNREIDAMRAKLPDGGKGVDRWALENKVIEWYQQNDAMDWVPSREARDLANQPYIAYPQHYPDDYKNAVELMKMYGLDNQVSPKKPNDLYRDLAGEADARLVQNRMNMSMDERLANPFYKGYDVPIEDQIIRFDDGTSMSEPLGNLGAFRSQLGAVDLPSGDKLPEEYFWFDLGKDKIEVVQNPSNAELARLSAEQRKKYRLTGDDPPLRFTEDEFGNRFYWPSHEAVHYQIEPMIKQRIGRDVNQNAQENARWAKRRAEKLAEMRK